MYRASGHDLDLLISHITGAAINRYTLSGVMENAGLENDGPTKINGVENARLENDGLKNRTGKCRTGICRTKEQGWKMQD